MLKRLGLALLLLLTAGAYAQPGTPVLIAHVASDANGDTTTAINTTGANAAFICGTPGVTPSDSLNNTWVTAYTASGYGGGASLYAAFGMTAGAAQTFSLSGGNPFEVMAFNHIASGPDQTVSNTSSSYPQVVGPITPSHANELIATCSMSVFRASDTPSTVLTSVPSTPAFTLGDNAISNAVNGYATAWMDAYQVQTTATATSASWNTNQANGQNSILASFYSDLSPTTLAITTTSLPGDMRTVVYPTTCLNVVGGTAPYTVTLGSGTLPTGLTFDGHCISGTPTVYGTTSGLVFHVVDHAGTTANSATLSVVITPYGSILNIPTPIVGGYVVMPGAVRHPGVMVTNPGSTGLMDYSIQEGSGYATLSCTSHCPGSVEVTVTATAGSCSVAGSVGSYSMTGGTIFHLIATDEDTNEDGSHSTASSQYRVCQGDHLVETQPVYIQAFTGQDKIVYGYVMGQIPQNITWSCTKVEDGSNCNSYLNSLTHRDVTFNGAAVGHYTLTASSISAYDGTTVATNYSTIFVGGAAPSACGTGPTLRTPTDTEAVACFADPATFGTDIYTVSPNNTNGTYDKQHIYDLPWHDGLDSGFEGIIENIDTTGTNPTQYAEYFYPRTSGTRAKPVHTCGVVDANACHNPVIETLNATSNATDTAYATANPNSNCALWSVPSCYFIWILPPNSTTGPAGYDTSNGPDYLNFTGLDIRSDGPATSRILAFESRSGRHLSLEGLSFTNLGEGMLLNNNATGTGRTASLFQSVIGSSFENCGDVPGYGNHCIYIEGFYPLVVGNRFHSLITDSGGSWVKERGGGSIFAYNSFSGIVAGPSLWWGDQADAAPYSGLELLLGPPGDTNCGDNFYCTGSSDIDWRHIMANEQSQAEDYLYGNVMSMWNLGDLYQYGIQAISACSFPYCNNTDDHTGGFKVWNNTFDRPDSALGSSANVFYNNGGRGYWTDVYSWPSVTLQNNSIWTNKADGRDFVLDLSATFQGKFITNMFATGAVSTTSPVIPGTSTGWGNQIGGGCCSDGQMPQWSASTTADKTTYVTGIDSSNFLTTTGIPYHPRDAIPNAGSPLIGAGTPITDARMSEFNLSYEPDPVGGYMIRRTADATTIGARSYQSVSHPTVVSQWIADAYNPLLPNVYSPYSPTFFCSQDCIDLMTQWSDGLVENDTFRAGNWTSSNPSTISMDAGTYNGGTYQFFSAGTSTISASYDPVQGRYGSTGTTGQFFTGTMPPATVGTPYNWRPWFNGGGNIVSKPQWTWSLGTGSLSAGLSIDPISGAVTGTPTTAGTTSGVSFKETLMNGGASPPWTTADPSNTTLTSSAMSMNVAASGALVVNTLSLPSGTVGSTYSATLSASGGTAPYTWVLTDGTLPAGLSLNGSTGVISGTPTTAGSSSGLIFTATDAASATAASNALTLTVNTAPPPTVATPTCSPSAGTYTSTQTVTCSSTTSSSTTYCTTDGTTPTTSSPACTSISIASTHTLKAISAAAGDTNSAVLTQLYTINTVSSPTVSTTTLPGGTVGSAYTDTLAATGGTSPYTAWALTSGTLPGGLALNTSTGVISGTPAASGTFSGLVFQVTDSAAQTASSGSLSVTIASLPTTATPTCSPAAGTYTGTQTVSCSSSTSSSTTYCTVDGTTPTTSSSVCTNVSVAASLTLKAISAASGDTNSAVLTQAYTINSAGPASKSIGASSVIGGVVIY